MAQRVSAPSRVRELFRKTTQASLVVVIAALVVGVAAAIIIQGGLFSVKNAAQGLAGANAQGSAYSARTHTGFETGSKDSLGTGYAANVGVFAQPLSAGAAPVLSVASVSSHLIANGSSVLLSLSVLYANVTGVNLTLPNGTILVLTITNGGNATVTADTLGRHNLTFFAYGTGGATSVTEYFDVVEGTSLTANVLDRNGDGTPSTLEAVNGSDLFATQASSNGTFSLVVPPILAGVRATAFESALIVTLQGVNLSNEGVMRLDEHNDIAGYLLTYGVETTFNFSGAVVNISYAGTGYADENRLRLFKCEPYLLANRTCAGTWSDVTAGATQDTQRHRFTYATSGFSGFSVKETAAPSSSGGGGGGGGGSLLAEMHVVVQKSCDERTVTASVTYGGVPLADTRVAAQSSEGTDIGETMTDAAGTAKLALPNGQYYLTFEHTDFSTQHGFLNLSCAAVAPAPPEQAKNDTQEPAPQNESAPPIAEQQPEPPPSEWVAENSTNTTQEQRDETVTSPQEQTAAPINETPQPSLFRQVLPWLLPIIILIPLAVFVVKKRMKKAPTKKEEKKVEKKEGKTQNTAEATAKKASAELQTTQEPAAQQTAPSRPLSTPPPAPILTPMPEEAQAIHPGWDTTSQPAAQADAIDIAIPTQLSEGESAQEPVHTPAHAPSLAETSGPSVTSGVATEQPSPLRQLDERQWFGLADGRKLKSIPELVKELPEMDDGLFFAHVTSDRNDFATWAYHAVGDTQLAAQIGPIKSKAELLRVLLDHIHSVSEQLARGAATNEEKKGAYLDALIEHYTTLGKKEAA